MIRSNRAQGGASAIVTAAILNLPSITNGPLGVTAIPPPWAFSYTIVSPRDYYWRSVALHAIAIAIVGALQRSHLGRAWRAIREDEVAAQARGIDEHGTLMQGDLRAIEREVRGAIEQTSGRRLMLGPGCVVPIAVRDDAIATVMRAARELPLA